MTSILYIPDTQCAPGDCFDHMEWAGRFALQKRPDWIVHGGDNWDMPSLSAYDCAAKKAIRGDDILADIEAGNEGMRRLFKPIATYNAKAKTPYVPKGRVLLGNHDSPHGGGRISRAVDAEPWLRGLFDAHPLEIPEGWEWVRFLEVLVIEGVAFSHFFPRAGSGSVMQSRRGAPSARAQVQREGRSCIAGHKQGLDTAVVETGAGRRRGIIAGSFYLSDMGYITPQGEDHWKGCLFLEDVKEGNFRLTELPIDHLRREYA